jgi:hypothetical protein
MANKWIVHLQKIRKENPKLAKSRPGSADFKKLIAIAKKSYK